MGDRKPPKNVKAEDSSSSFSFVRRAAIKALRFLSNHFVLVASASFLFGLAHHIRRYLLMDELQFLDWKITQYGVSYQEYGFVKRGLIGTILSPLSGILNFEDRPMRWVVILLSIGVSVVLILMMARAFSATKTAIGADPGVEFYALKAVIALGFAGSLQIAYDLGRFDALMFVILICSLHLIRRQHFFLAALASTVAPFVHEAYLVFATPLVVAVWIQTTRAQGIHRVPGSEWRVRKHVVGLAGFATVSLIVGAFIVFFGNSNAVLTLPLGIGQKVWERGALDLPTIGALDALIVLTILVASYGWLLSLYRRNAHRPDAVFVAALSPLVLYVVGIDFARWTGIVVWVVLLAGLANLTSFGFTIERPSKIALLALGILSLPLGPLGITSLFPYLELLIGKLL